MCQTLSIADVIVEAKLEPLVVHVRGVVEVMLVERVKECEADLEISTLPDGGVLRNRKVHVLRVWDPSGWKCAVPRP